MIALLARLNVAEGKEAEFETVMLELAAQVRSNEPGNQLYTLVKDDQGYAVMELYDDDEALRAHGASDHFRAAGAKFRGLMAGAPDLQRFRGRRLAHEPALRPRAYRRPASSAPLVRSNLAGGRTRASALVFTRALVTRVARHATRRSPPQPSPLVVHRGAPASTRRVSRRTLGLCCRRSAHRRRA